MPTRYTALLLALSALALPGCRSLGSSCHDPQLYATAQTTRPLGIPPGLDAPDTRNALQIPELKEPAPPPRKPGQPCLDAPPQYEVVKQPEA
jgi:hypothetical protein